jgi:choice-of-anchor B domain-containing protein
MFKQANTLLILFMLPMFCLAQDGVEATLLGHWHDPSIPGSSFYDNRYNEVWGHYVNGREIGIIGSTQGTHFIDVTDPSSVEEVAFVAGKFQGTSVVHRDYKTFGNYIYAVCDEGPSSLQIFDVSDLPDTVYTVYDSDALFVRAHNCWVDTSSQKFYLFAAGGGALGFTGLAVYDISEPLNPVFINKFNSIGGFGFGHVHDGFVRNDTAYLNCGNDGFCVADFSNPASPTLLGTMTGYQGAGYNHAGWLSEDAQYYYLTDETHGSPVKTVDVSDFADISVVDTYNAESVQSQIPHNPIVACDNLYVSYYYDGLQVYDISDPENVTRALYYDTYDAPDGTSYKGAWGVYPFLPSGNILVSDMQTGLYVFEGVGDGCNGLSVAVKNPAQNDFEIYPQPASDFLIIAMNGSLEGMHLQLVNSEGKTVWFKANLPASDQVQLELPAGLPNGLYILHLKGEKQMSTHKLLIQRD